MDLPHICHDQSDDIVYYDGDDVVFERKCRKFFNKPYSSFLDVTTVVFSSDRDQSNNLILSLLYNSIYPSLCCKFFPNMKGSHKQPEIYNNIGKDKGALLNVLVYNPDDWPFIKTVVNMLPKVKLVVAIMNEELNKIWNESLNKLNIPNFVVYVKVEQLNELSLPDLFTGVDHSWPIEWDYNYNETIDKSLTMLEDKIKNKSPGFILGLYVGMSIKMMLHLSSNKVNRAYVYKQLPGILPNDQCLDTLEFDLPVGIKYENSLMTDLHLLDEPRPFYKQKKFSVMLSTLGTLKSKEKGMPIYVFTHDFWKLRCNLIDFV
ncbi:hypothetical protein [Salmon gill poxvirus]